MVEIEEVSEVEAAAAITASSSSAEYHHTHRCKYDVFLSFRGKDIRKTFIDHLHSAFKRSGIYTFKDDERLETGESISPALLKAIEESSFAVVVFSRNYASSWWCLDELVKIMECSSKSPKGQTVIPVFYDVKPSDVRHQKGHFGEMFRQHNSDKVQIWKKALTDAANLSGLELDETANGHESKFIDRIVQEIWSKLPSKIKVEDKVLFGMKSRIEKVTALLGEESNVVRTVGIWGLSGIGKSTLARAVYRQIEDQFDASCFLDEVREASKKDGLRSLQRHLLSKVLGMKDLQIASDIDGIALMTTRLRSIRVLLVLDDVDSSEQLEALAGSHEWFGPGSRIIITTTNRKPFIRRNEVQIHELSVLDCVEATKLFRWKAFNDMCPTKDLEELSVQVIDYCEGLPLALEVLGSALCNEGLYFWKDSLRKLRKVGPGGNILKKLKIGFDGLEGNVQNTFLDIACFFKGRHKKHVTRILDSFDFYPGHSLPILVHKSLIHCSNGWVCMHKLIREMGRHIVHQKHIVPQNAPEPGKYSRLWDTNDIEHVLTSDTGTEYIEGILLDPQRILLDCHEQEYKIEMRTEAFRKMAKLRLLEIHNTCISKGPHYLPNELRWIDWDKYPSNSLPTMFEAYVLVGLRLHHSGLKQLWEGRTKKKLGKLKYVDLSYSRNLVGISHLEDACNLEELILQECTSLVKVDLSIGFFKKLVCLNMAGCEKLRSLPEAIHLEYLEILNLSGCVKLQKFPEIRENMDKLLQLHLEETAIKELPSSIGYIHNLVLIDLRGCKNLEILPSTLWTLKLLKSLVLSGCSKVEKLPEEMGNLECLEKLLLDGTAVTELPPSIQRLKNLKFLSCCKSSSQSRTSFFQSFFPFSKRQKITMSLVLPPIWGLTSLTKLDLTNCNLLESPRGLGSLFSLEELKLGGNKFENLPSLNQLSQLAHVELNRCEMLRELPELPSGIRRLFANDCVSLSHFADRFAISKLGHFWFQNCRKLLDCGRNEILASMLLQRRLKRRMIPETNDLPEKIILPGGVIPEWFCDHTFTGDPFLLKIPQNNKITCFSFFVILEVVNKVRSYKYPYRGGWDNEHNHRVDLSWSGLRHDDRLTDAGVLLSIMERGKIYLGSGVPIYLRDTDNIIGLEHTIMGTRELYFCECHECSDCLLKEPREIEVDIRPLSPDVVVKKWGVRLFCKETDNYISWLRHQFFEEFGDDNDIDVDDFEHHDDYRSFRHGSSREEECEELDEADD